jgi:hypothetical protein
MEAGTPSTMEESSPTAAMSSSSDEDLLQSVPEEIASQVFSVSSSTETGSVHVEACEADLDGDMDLGESPESTPSWTPSSSSEDSSSSSDESSGSSAASPSSSSSSRCCSSSSDEASSSCAAFPAQFAEECDEWRMADPQYADVEGAPSREGPCVLPWIYSSPITFEESRGAEEDCFTWLYPRGMGGWLAPRPSPVKVTLAEYFRSRMRMKDPRFRRDPAYLLLAEAVLRHKEVMSAISVAMKNLRGDVKKMPTAAQLASASELDMVTK